MIGVGINENIVFENVEVNDKKHLVISLREKSEKSLFEEMSEEDVTEGSGKLSLRIFPFQVPNKADLTTDQKVDRIIGDVRKTRNQLIHILANYLPKGEIKLDQYAGCGFTKETPNDEFKRKMMSEAVLDKIWSNTVNGFIRMMRPLCSRDELAVRLKLRRQSKDKHFPTFPDRYLEQYPFIEPMTVTKEQSKVKFSDYEIKEGLDKPDVLPSSDADPIPSDVLDTESIDHSMFEPQ